jgi:hypothetical protein
MVRGAWRCAVAVPQPIPYDGTPADPPYCGRCGATVDPHPVDICERCGHLVEFHGHDTEGCGRISAAGWCVCRRSFGRPHAEYVRYW